jgi:hypothetical protein
LGGRGTCLALKALDQKNRTIKLPSIVPANSTNQSKGISPNGRSLWAKHASITVIPRRPLFRIIAGSFGNSCSAGVTRGRNRGPDLSSIAIAVRFKICLRLTNPPDRHSLFSLRRLSGLGVDQLDAAPSDGTIKPLRKLIPTHRRDGDGGQLWGLKR